MANQQGRTFARRHPLPRRLHQALPMWERHPEPISNTGNAPGDPLSAARNARKKRRGREVERGEPKDSERGGG